MMACATSYCGHFGQPGSEPELSKEGARLMTYRAFPTSVAVSTFRLAQAGFYYTGEGDMVKCFCCGVTYQGWKMGDKPQGIHAAISPHCPLVAGQGSANIPLPKAMTTLPDFSQVQSSASGYGSASVMLGNLKGSLDHDGFEQSEKMSSSRPPSTPHVPYPASSVISPYLPSTSSEGMSLQKLPSYLPLDSASVSNGTRALAASISQPKLSAHECDVASQPPNHKSCLFPTNRLDLGGAVYPNYALMDTRRKSFQNWRQLPELPGIDELVSLGFFYAGYADCVRCFFCGIGLKSWEPGDDPAKVHANWRPNCDYIRLVKGDNFIDSVIRVGRERVVCSCVSGQTTVPPAVCANGSGLTSSQNGNGTMHALNQGAEHPVDIDPKVPEQGSDKNPDATSPNHHFQRFTA